MSKPADNRDGLVSGRAWNKISRPLQAHLEDREWGRPQTLSGCGGPHVSPTHAHLYLLPYIIEIIKDPTTILLNDDDLCKL